MINKETIKTLTEEWLQGNDSKSTMQMVCG